MDASIELSDPSSKARVFGRLTEISQSGCFVEIPNLLRVNFVARLRVCRSGHTFRCWARVIHNRSRDGVGLYFINPAPDQMQLLGGWLRESG
jgi:hypothetical protein